SGRWRCYGDGFSIALCRARLKRFNFWMCGAIGLSRMSLIELGAEAGGSTHPKLYLDSSAGFARKLVQPFGRSALQGTGKLDYRLPQRANTVRVGGVRGPDGGESSRFLR